MKRRHGEGQGAIHKAEASIGESGRGGGREDNKGEDNIGRTKNFF